mmetsp:Transcript_11559/g.32521  ORF Transcript_11559/g.32521 Transcript_11559/m.32521 type:complete len:230 (-) Transcript_11559:117-806(-)
MVEILMAWCRATIPLPICWKTRERIGGGMLSTPVLMFVTIRTSIHCSKSATLQSASCRYLRLSASMPSGSSSSTLKAMMWEPSVSSISPRARAWSMLKSRTIVCLNSKTFSSALLECTQKAQSAAAASYHWARMSAVWRHASQNLVYDWEVLNTMRKPTRKEKPFQGAASNRIPRVSSQPTHSCSRPRSTRTFSPVDISAHGSPTYMPNGKALPPRWKRLMTWWNPPLL